MLYTCLDEPLNSSSAPQLDPNLACHFPIRGVGHPDTRTKATKSHHLNVDGFAKGFTFPYLLYFLSRIVSLVFNESRTLCCCPSTLEVAHEHYLLTSCDARRNRDPQTGIRPRLPFLSRRQAPGHSPQSVYNRNVHDGILKTHNEAERALDNRVLAPLRILVIFLKNDLETETIFSASQRGGHHPRGTLNRHQARALHRGKNLLKTLFTEMPKDDQY